MIKLEATEIKLDPEWVSKLNLRELALTEILNTRTRIVKDLNSGKGGDGNPLKPYSRAYALLKAASGRSRTPNLNVTGEFHRSLIPAKTPEGAELAFQGSHSPESPFTDKAKAKLRAHSAKRIARGLTGVYAKTAKSAKSATKAKGSSVVKSTAKAVSHGGKSIQNAALAASLYAKGFIGWLTFDRTDKERIDKAILKKIDDHLKNLIDKK